MRKKKLIYLGSPYTSPNKEVMQARFEAISRIAAGLTKEGYIVFSPITYGHTLCNFAELPVEFDFWNDFCLEFLSKSDLFVQVNLMGWESSKGLKAELEFCKENDISSITVNGENGIISLDRTLSSLVVAFSPFVKVNGDGSCSYDIPVSPADENSEFFVRVNDDGSRSLVITAKPRNFKVVSIESEGLSGGVSEGVEDVSEYPKYYAGIDVADGKGSPSYFTVFQTGDYMDKVHADSFRRGMEEEYKFGTSRSKFTVEGWMKSFKNSKALPIFEPEYKKDGSINFFENLPSLCIGRLTDFLKDEQYSDTFKAKVKAELARRFLEANVTISKNPFVKEVTPLKPDMRLLKFYQAVYQLVIMQINHLLTEELNEMMSHPNLSKSVMENSSYTTQVKNRIELADYFWNKITSYNSSK